MLFELRIYDVAIGRRADMEARMRDELARLFRRHEVPLAGAWMIEAGSRLPRFAYLTAHQSVEMHAACWAGFYGDPDWIEARERTNAGSELVERGEVIHGTPIDGASSQTKAGNGHVVDELVILDLYPGSAPRATTLLADTLVPEIEAMGGSLLGMMNITSGHPIPAFAVFLRWPSSLDHADRARVLDENKSLRGGDPIRSTTRLPLSPLRDFVARPGLMKIL